MPGPATRYIATSALLLGSALALSANIGRRYGGTARLRFAAGAMGTVLGQQLLVGLALQRTATERERSLSPVDVMTLSRGVAAALLAGLLTCGVRDRRGAAGWMGWTALIYGAILCDWLDGPIARQLGTSEAGAMFDLELDSWLTVCSAVAACAWGGLPAYPAIPPLIRYPLLFGLLRRKPYMEVKAGDPPWVRHIGMAQMMLYIAALAPFGGPVTRLCVRLAAPVVTPVSLGSMLLVYRRKLHG